MTDATRKTRQQKRHQWRKAARGIMASLIVGLAGATGHAATGTWTGGAGGIWDTTNTNWTVVGNPAWDSTNGPTNVALFGTVGDSALLGSTVFADGITFNESASINGPGSIGFAIVNTDIAIDVASGKVGTLAADMASTFNGGGNGNRLFKTGSGDFVITSNVNLSSASDENKGGYFTVNGGGEMEIRGFLSTMGGAGTNRGNAINYIGDTSSGNTLSVTNVGFQNGRLVTGIVQIGGGANGNNTLNISAPGNSGDPTWILRGNSARLQVVSDNNSVLINNGAYVATQSGGGTGTWSLGGITGVGTGSNNTLTVDGAGTVLARSNSNFTEVGLGGNNNALIVQNGGTLLNGRVGIGLAGGDDNYQLITGAGSTYTANAGGNHFFEIGRSAGSTGNSFRVEAGAVVNQGGSGGNRVIGVGEVATADNNYIRVTGAGSTLNFVNSQLALVIGGTVNNSIFASGGDGNHLDVYSGGVLDMDNADFANANVTQSSTAVVLMGTNSDFNLGDGTGVSTAYVGGTKTYASGPITGLVTGVLLHSADSQLNVNSGRLVAGVAGNLVSGSGSVVLNGVGYFDSNSNNVTISTAVGGVGDFHKEGAGVLTLSSSSNSYSGDTYVDAGTLSISDDYLDDLADVLIASGAVMDLTTGVGDTVAGLALNGVGMAIGTWGSSASGAANVNDTYFSGTGWLIVTEVFVGGGGGGGIPSPAALPAGLALLAFGAMRRQR